MIKLGEFTFPPRPDAGGGWWYEDLTDWFSLPTSKSGRSSRPVWHGSFSPGVPYRESASPSFKLHYDGESPADAALALRHLNGLAAHVDLIAMTVDAHDGELTRMVEVKNIDTPDTHGSELVTTTVYCWAADPLLYGPLVAASTGVPTPGVGVADPVLDPFQEGAPGNLGRVAFTNSGKAPTSVEIAVTGGLSAGVQVHVIETGQTLRLERLIPDGSVIRFNSRTGRATIDGQSDVTGFLTVDEWPMVPPGETYTFQFTPLGIASGVPQLTVSARPAFF